MDGPWMDTVTVASTDTLTEGGRQGRTDMHRFSYTEMAKPSSTLEALYRTSYCTCLE